MNKRAKISNGGGELELMLIMLTNCTNIAGAQDLWICERVINAALDFYGDANRLMKVSLICLTGIKIYGMGQRNCTHLCRYKNYYSMNQLIHSFSYSVGEVVG